MRNLKLEIEYDGTNYCGWQIQKSCHAPASPRRQLKSIQETIEKSLRQILQEKVKLTASGRTDAGVHALGQVANFKTRSNIPSKKLQLALNCLLPKDITVSRIEEAAPDFHSRFSAKSKIYRYTILNRAFPSAHSRDNAYFYPHPLNVLIMRNESKALIGRHDFTSFKATDKKKKNPRKLIKKIKIAKHNDYIYIDIEADSFLYNMVRNIVGTLIKMGRPGLPAGSLKKILGSKDRKAAGPTAPACGLMLIKVKY